MHWVTIIIVGIAANLDNLGIGLAYGVKETRIPILSNIIIAFISMTFTYFAVIAGGTLSEYISPNLANYVGSSLLCVIGLWTLFSKRLTNPEPFKNPELIDWDDNHVISWREAIYLGLILSLNCMASGLGIGANGISALWTVLSIGFFSLVTIGIGSHFGYLLNKTFIGKYSTSISGWLLIIIGLYEMLV